MAVELVRKLWTVEEYEEMIEKGILDKYDRVELIRGEIVQMAPIGVRHASCVTRVQTLFHRVLDDEMITVSVQNPIQLPNDSEPQPDIALLKGNLSLYSWRRPTVEDVLLLVEVSDSTLATDRRVKIPLYAEAGIAEVWLVNLDEEVVEVYSEPVGGKYGKVVVVGRGETVGLPGGLGGGINLGQVLG